MSSFLRTYISQVLPASRWVKSAALLSRPTILQTRSFLTTPSLHTAPPKNSVKGKKKLSEAIGIPEDLLPPSRPPTSYFLFVKDWNLAHGTKLGTKERAQRASEAWKNLGEDERKVYSDRGRKGQAQYKEEVQKWVNTIHPNLLQRIRGRMHKLGLNSVRAAVEREKRPAPAYALFVRDFYAKHANELGSRNERADKTMAEVSKAWRALTEAEKDVYRAQFKAKMEKYRATVEKSNLKNVKNKRP